jgi:uncharacterized membrane protein
VVNIIFFIGIIGMITMGIWTITLTKSLDTATGMKRASKGMSSNQIWNDKFDSAKKQKNIAISGLIVSVILFGSGTYLRYSKSEDKNGNSISEIHNVNDSTQINASDKLVDLKKMFDNGLITQEEYDSKRKEILDKI